METREKPNLLTPVVRPGFCRARLWLGAGYHPSFPEHLSHHHELCQAPRTQALCSPLGTKQGGQ